MRDKGRPALGGVAAIEVGGQEAGFAHYYRILSAFRQNTEKLETQQGVPGRPAVGGVAASEVGGKEAVRRAGHSPCALCPPRALQHMRAERSRFWGS